MKKKYKIIITIFIITAFSIWSWWFFKDFRYVPDNTYYEHNGSDNLFDAFIFLM